MYNICACIYLTCLQHRKQSFIYLLKENTFMMKVIRTESDPNIFGEIRAYAIRSLYRCVSEDTRSIVLSVSQCVHVQLQVLRLISFLAHIMPSLKKISILLSISCKTVPHELEGFSN